MIFGGTDLNEHIQDSKKFRLMTRVVGNAKCASIVLDYQLDYAFLKYKTDTTLFFARNLVAFSQTLAFKAEELWVGGFAELVFHS